MAKSTTFDPMGLLQELENESDRAAAVLGPALLDHLLGQMFRVALHADTKADVFEFRGPLGDFAGRIEMAFALGWLDADTRDDLSVIRKIRNEFAHDVDHTLRFADQTYRDRLRQMHCSKHVLDRIRVLEQKYLLPPEGTKAMKETIANLESPRSQFQFAIVVLAGPITEVIQEGRLAQKTSKGVLAFIDPILTRALEPLERGLAAIAASSRTA